MKQKNLLLDAKNFHNFRFLFVFKHQLNITPLNK